MMRAHWLAILGAIAAFFTATQADAGPIRWSYTAEELPHEPFRTLAAEVRWPDGTFEGASGETVGATIIWYTFGGYTPIEPSDPDAVSDFLSARVTITDQKSDRSTSVLLTVGAFEQWEYHWAWDEWEPISMGELSGGTETLADVVLGRNRYLIEGQGGAILVTAEELSNPPAVPEPGTLGLAAVGIAGSWTARRLRRNKT
jgi:PEP-CTERM motif